MRRPGGGLPEPAQEPGEAVEYDLSGVVGDLAGTPLSSVRISLGGLSAVTGADGRYEFVDLSEGGYVIALQASSGEFDCRSIVVAASQLSYDFVLPNISPGLRVTRVEPRLGSAGNGLGEGMELELSGPAEAASVSPDDFEIGPDVGEISVEVSPDGRTITLQPLLQLKANTTIQVELTGEIRGQSGGIVSRPARWSFRTAITDNSAPRLLRIFPPDGATDVARNQAIRFEFNETLSSEQLALLATITPDIQTSAEAEGRFLTLSAVGGWQVNTNYSLTLQNVSDLNGNVNSDPLATAFATGDQLIVSRNINAEWNRVSERIAFASDREGNFDIWSIAADGTELRQLTDTPQDELQPSLSEDGARLVFQRRAANGKWDILRATVNDEGVSEAVAITPLEFNDSEPQFSRTLSNQILFVSDRGSRNALFSMNDDGSSPTDLDPDFTASASQPAYHPLLDGQMLFTAFNGSERDIWRKSVSIVDGTAVNTNITSGRLSDDYSPAWGPDASFVVFLSDFNGADDLWIAAANGEFPQQVTNFGGGVSDPCVSPLVGDNSCVLTLEREDGGSDLVIVNLLSGAVVRILTSPEGDPQ